MENWLTRISYHSGYLVPEMAPRRWKNYDDRQKIIESTKAEAKKEATQLVEANGHELSDRWDVLNANHCVKCGKRIYIRMGDWYDSMSKPRIQGFLLEDKCENKHGDVPFSVPDWSAHRVVKDSYPGSLWQ